MDEAIARRRGHGEGIAQQINVMGFVSDPPVSTIPTTTTTTTTVPTVFCCVFAVLSYVVLCHAMPCSAVLSMQ